MSKFNIGDKIISKGYPNLGAEVGVIVGIDPGKDAKAGKYFVKFDSLDICDGWVYEIFCDDPHLIIEQYEGCAVWVHEDDLIKVEDEGEEDEHEENVKMEFDKIREQKKEVIKGISEKVLEMTLEIKEMEHEIEKIKKEWHLD